MKRNLELLIPGPDGQPAKGPNDQPLDPAPKLKDMVMGACLLQHPQDSNMPVKMKIDLWKLAKKCDGGGVVELTNEEISLLKDRIGLIYNVAFAGASTDLLETDYVPIQ